MASRFGSIAASLKGRSQLSRGKAKVFVILGYYRLGMQAVIILALNEWPVLQIIGIMQLNFIWVIILIKFWPCVEERDNYFEIIN